MQTQKPLICLRCKATLKQGEARCKTCATEDAVKQSTSASSSGDENEGKPTLSSSDRVLGTVGLLIFLFVTLALGAKFFHEYSTNGFGSALQKQPGFLLIVGGIAFLKLLSSRNELERMGLGAAHKALRVGMLLVLGGIALIYVLSILGSVFGVDSPGLPDNVRF